MIKNGRPYTIENGAIDASLITDHPEQEIKRVCDWIEKNIRPRKTPLLEKTGYQIKHILAKDTGIYLTNNEFKDAMLMCGYSPVNPDDTNWKYCISKRSPAFSRKN